MITLDKSLDLDDPEATAFLQRIQGNILKSHGRDHVNLLFLQFSDPRPIPAWIAEFARTRITSAQQQREDTQRWRASNAAANLSFVSLFLSFDGYKDLGMPGDKIPWELRRTYFERGMKAQAFAERPFNDPPVTTWDADYQGMIHALILHANDDPEVLESDTKALIAEVTAWTSARWVERGHRLTFQFPTRDELITIEHFGNQDGISDPIVIKQDAEKQRQVRGGDKWDPEAPLSLLLHREPGAAERYGSFLVFRKLEQNVKGYHQALDDLAKVLGLSGAAV